MIKTPFGRSAYLVSAASLVSMLPLIKPAVAQDNARSGTTVHAEEIVVTARKREESIQDVPLSVLALSGDALERQGISDTAELATAVPGISMQDGGPGYRAIFIRGVSSERGNASTTSFYIDEAPVQPGGIVQSIVEPLYFDVSRVEVLRGPQGTLFGGSSMGGTVRIISNAPDPSRLAMAAGVDLSLTKDGGLNNQFSGMVNIPIVDDRIAFRAAGSIRHNDGFVDRLIAPGGFTGADRAPVGPVDRQKNVNPDDSTTLRAAMLFKIGENAELTPSVFHQNTKGRPGSFDIPPSQGDQRRMVEAEPEYLKDKVTVVNLLGKIDLGAVDLISSTTMNWRRSGFSEDGSDFMRETFLPSNGLPPTAIIANYDGYGKAKTFSQEVRLSSSAEGPLQYVVGAFYERHSTEGTATVLSSDLLAKFPIAALFYPDGILFSSANEGLRKQVALFGEVSYELLPKLTVSAGARYYDFKLSATQFAPTAVTRSKEDGVSPRLTLSYALADNNILYSTISRGFRPGGPGRKLTPLYAASCRAQYAAAGIGIDADGVVDPYEADSLWNYEVGIKTQTADRRLTFNAAAYAIDWKDIQQLYFPSCGAASTQNFGNARIRGVEADISWAPAPGLNIFGGASYNSAEIAEDVPSLGLVKGTELQNTPKWTGSLSAEYRFEGVSGAETSLLMNVRHVGRSYRDFDRTNPWKFQDDYTVVGLRASMVVDTVNVSLYVDNLFDTMPVVSNHLSSFGYVPSRERGFTIRPRTVGISVRSDF